MTASRRAFFRATASLAGLGAWSLAPRVHVPLALGLAGLGAMATHSAHAAGINDGYKALVCLYLAGGNDSHNWLLPTDTTNRESYVKARGELAWPTSRVQEIGNGGQASGRSFGMPMELAPLKKWYDLGKLAWLANVGTLVRPISKADFHAGVGLPTKLFSHNDQAATWQSLQPEGGRTGWGGRMGDILMAANQQPVFTAVSASGNAVFLSGSVVTQYQVGYGGPVVVNSAQDGWHAGSAAVPGELRRLLASPGGNAFEAEYLRVVQRSLSTAGALQTALASGQTLDLPSTPVIAPGGTSLVLANESLARQLRVVAQMIAAGPSLGMKRQVFMVGIGGFDSHSFQLRDQPLMMGRVAHSVDWFLQSLQNMGQLNNVALFSASDFGRTLATNGDGCDHGWGGHHFVAGGAIRGGMIHGTMPITALGTDDDLGSGRTLPSTSVTQYAASLGTWMGLSPTDLRTALPNLASFSAGPQLF